MIFGLGKKKNEVISEAEALPGRDAPVFEIPATHAVLGTPIQPPFPDHTEQAVFALGCFWGPERVLWQLDGIYTTAVGYAGGFTKYPTYREVCSGSTGHSEAVLVVYDPANHQLSRSAEDLLGVARPNAAYAPGE